MYTSIAKGFCKYAISDSVDLGYGLRFYITSTLPGDVDIASPLIIILFY